MCCCRFVEPAENGIKPELVKVLSMEKIYLGYCVPRSVKVSLSTLKESLSGCQEGEMECGQLKPQSLIFQALRLFIVSQ